MRNSKTTLFAVALAMATGLTVARASGPVSVYSLIDKVSFDPGPDAGKAERIRIEGVFIVATSQSSYGTPQRGVLEFTLPSTGQDVARREWADLLAFAGTRQVMAFGSAWFAVIPVGKPGSKTSAPGAYPMGNGLIRINADQPRAKELLDFKGQ